MQILKSYQHDYNPALLKAKCDEALKELDPLFEAAFAEVQKDTKNIIFAQIDAAVKQIQDLLESIKTSTQPDIGKAADLNSRLFQKLRGVLQLIGIALDFLMASSSTLIKNSRKFGSKSNRPEKPFSLLNWSNLKKRAFRTHRKASWKFPKHGLRPANLNGSCPQGSPIPSQCMHYKKFTKKLIEI